MYLTNKYTNTYYNIINRSKTRILNGYIEKHHIIPKSLGGSNNTENIAKLTAREHYLCHYLLTKMTVGKDKVKMFHALRFLNANNKKSSRVYAYIRLNLFITSQEKISLSIETRKKISESMKGRVAHNKGKKQIHKQHKKRSDNVPIGSNGKLKGLVRPKLCCISCKKEVDVANLARYHTH